MASPPIQTNALVTDDLVGLLCTEDAFACLSDNDDKEDGTSRKCRDDEEYGYGDKINMFIEEESTPLELQHALCTLMERERLYSPEPDFLLKLQSGMGIDGDIRKKAVCRLLKMHKFFEFSEHTASLSINYLDRFLSLHRLLLSGRAWTLQLLTIACLSLAAKMEEIEVPVLLDLQVGSERVFEPRTVKRMELLVLSTLGWRMNSVTPLSYTNHFINGFGLPIHTKKALISKANKYVLSSIQEMRFLRFRPSSIAAAATLCAVQEDLPVHFVEHRKSLQCVMPQESKGELISCHARMSELYCTAYTNKDDDQCGSSPVPQSPVAVLDASFSSNSNNNSHSSFPPISSPSPPKKRRTDDPS